MGLLITLGLGIFVLIGAAIAGFAKSDSNICEISVAVALGAIGVLLLGDLIPETIEGVEHLGWLFTIIAIALGFIALVILDRFLPDSPSAHNQTHMHCSALHISVATAVALTVHNIIEGMSVYGVSSQSVMAALLLAFGIGIHNIPMGMIVYSGVRSEVRYKRVGLVAVAALSTFIGGLIMFALGVGVDDRAVHFMIALTVGLLLYIVICELIPGIIRTSDKKIAVIGIIVGAVVVLIGIMLAASGGGH